MDDVFRALADSSRRRLLDRLNARNGQSLNELCSGLRLTRQAVAKHLAVLDSAGLVTSVRRGREKLHYLNAAPINDIARRWISAYDLERADALADLKQALEDTMPSPTQPTTTPDPMATRTDFVYVTYVETTPERLWQALTDPAFTLRYWGAELKSEWTVGSPVLWREGDSEFRDWGQEVLEADPPRRLAYTWHKPQPEHKEYFGWSDERFAELLEEKRSKVTFDLAPEGPVVKLTVVHDDFEPGSEMLRAVSGGWPQILSSLKTLLETGDALTLDSDEDDEWEAAKERTR